MLRPVVGVACHRRLAYEDGATHSVPGRREGSPPRLRATEPSDHRVAPQILRVAPLSSNLEAGASPLHAVDRYATRSAPRYLASGLRIVVAAPCQPVSLYRHPSRSTRNGPRSRPVSVPALCKLAPERDQAAGDMRRLQPTTSETGRYPRSARWPRVSPEPTSFTAGRQRNHSAAIGSY